ncbi:MAG: hypothetical protein EOP56_08175 [Sphingobacteriales bacterium]|nr:MAG: hypothetical protein EOP56_08175 [Sphingobacteriales bacterium]
MTSPLINACKSITDRAEMINGIDHVAIWNNQIQGVIDGTGDPFHLPALFVELLFGTQHNLGVKVTQADLTWRLHIAHEQLISTPDQSFVVMELRDQVKKAFLGYKPTNCGRLQYVTEVPDTNHGNLYHYTIDFTCSFIDTKGSPLDPDSDDWLIKEPPTCIEINIDKENQL